MHAEPITDRMNHLLVNHRQMVTKLIKCGWSDDAIAGNLQSDRLTVRRVRKLIECGLN